MGHEARVRRRQYHQELSTRSLLHRHPDAYLLLSYRCPRGHLEWVYNNRDGSVPPSIGCDECPAMMKRCNYNQDEYQDPKRYRPEVGSRVFVPMTDHKLEARTREFVQKHWADFAGKFESVEDAVEVMVKVAKEREEQVGYGVPDLVTVVSETVKRMREEL